MGYYKHYVFVLIVYITFELTAWGHVSRHTIYDIDVTTEIKMKIAIDIMKLT